MADLVKPFAGYAQVNVPRIIKQLNNKSPVMTKQMMFVTMVDDQTGRITLKLIALMGIISAYLEG